jgi:hypothetical protein
MQDKPMLKALFLSPPNRYNLRGSRVSRSQHSHRRSDVCVPRPTGGRRGGTYVLLFALHRLAPGAFT